MNRCPCFSLHTLGALALAGAAALLGVPAGAQSGSPTAAAGRHFPAAALRASVSFEPGSKLQLNGKPARTAPGLRIFNRQNQLVQPHSLRGQTYIAHYLIERSTGLLHTVWLLTEAEAAQPRNAPGMVQRNYQFASDAADAPATADHHPGAAASR